MKKIHYYWITILLVSMTVAAKSRQDWQETTAEFEISKEKTENLKFDNTLLGLLIQESGRPLSEILESDQKTMMSFTIKYSASVKLSGVTSKRCIIQRGLYKTLHPVLQTNFKHFVSPTPIKIRFATDDPILIQFILNKEYIAAPALLSNTIDDEWKPSQVDQSTTNEHYR